MQTSTIRIEPYATAHEPAVISFNARLRAGGSRYKLPAPPPPQLEGFVAVDGEAVRGGYFVAHQSFVVAGNEQTVQHLELPVSEGTVDPRHSPVGLQILMHAQRRHPFMYSLGIGGLDHPLPRMLATMGWHLRLVPFYFRVLRATPFLRNIVALRTTRVRRLAADLAATWGLGRVTFAALHLARTTPSLTWRVYTSEVVDSFGPWADDVWTFARPGVTFAAARTAAALERAYPRSRSALRTRARGPRRRHRRLGRAPRHRHGRPRALRHHARRHRRRHPRRARPRARRRRRRHARARPPARWRSW